MLEGYSTDGLEKRKAELAETYRDEVDRALDAGNRPIGLFGRGTEEEHLTILQRWEDNREKYDQILNPGEAQIVSFGSERSSENRKGVSLRIPLEETSLDVPGIEIYGETGLYDSSLTQSWRLDTSTSKRTSPNKSWEKKSIRPYIEHLALSAARPEWSEREREVVPLIAKSYGKYGPTSDGGVFPGIEGREARNALREIVTALLGTPNDELAPYKCVREVVEGEHADLAAAIDENNKPWTSPYCEYGPIDDWERFDVCDDVERLVRDRFRHHPLYNRELES